MEYEVIVLDDPFGNIKNQEVAKRFTQLIQMKRDGYWSKHSGRYLPFNKEDYICTHVLLIDKDSDQIVMAFKICRKSICELYGINFPMDDYMSSANDIDKAKYKRFIKPFESLGEDIIYSGGWTVNPSYKGKGLSNELKDIYTCIHYHIQKRFNINCMTAIGVMNFNTDKFFTNDWGVISFTGTVYNFKACPYLDCIFIGLDMDKVVQKKLDMADKYKYLWDARVEFIEDVERQAA